MFKFLQKYIDGAQIKSSIKFAFIYCVLFNSAVFINNFQYYQADIFYGILEVVKDFIYLQIILFVIFFGLGISRILFIFSSLSLFITGAAASYYLFFYSIAPTAGFMPVLFGTNETEVFELLSVKLVSWIAFSIFVCLYGIKYWGTSSKLLLNKAISVLFLYFLAFNIVTPKYSILNRYFPTQYLHNSYEYFMGSPTNIEKEDISLKYSFVDKSDDDVIFVLIIGESARYDHFGINGYNRDTTPNLAKRDDIVSLKATSCGNNTFVAVPGMLSRLTEKDFHLLDTETTFLSILTRLGFDTIWMGTQSIAKYYRNKPGGSFYDEVNFHMIPGGSFIFLPNDLDARMLPYLEQNLETKGKKFIILHSTGSHWDYSKRYTKEYAKFQPDLFVSSLKQDPASCKREELINSYDNSILYTDFFISSVFDRLKDKKAFAIYVSDHGESLGENGCFVHGVERFVKEQREIPFVVWASDSYKASYPSRWKAVQSLKGSEISQDYIFHSTLDCLGVESEIVDKSLSLCQPK